MELEIPVKPEPSKGAKVKMAVMSSSPLFVPIRAGVNVLAHDNGEPKRYATQRGAQLAAAKLKAVGHNVEAWKAPFGRASYVKQVA